MSLSRGAALFISAAGVLILGCGDPTSPPNPTPLATPTDLTIQELASGDIEVSWHDNSDNERSFELRRSSSGPSGPYSVLASVDADVSTYQDSQIDGVSEYCYRVRALGPSGTAPSLLSATICHQLGPPIAPSQLAATATFGQVDLSWSDNSDNEETFEIWKSTDGANATFTPEASVAAGVTGYGNTGLQDGSEYCYRVRAVGTKGQTSSFSNTVCATTLVPTTPPPDPPTNLAASASSTAISLVWNDNSSSEQGFEVWRSTAGPLGTYALLSTVGANTTNSTDTGLTPGTQYCYQVRAVGGAAVPPSAFSNSSCATTPAAPPAAPTNLLATAVTASRIDLAWQDNATDEEQYEIWRSTTGASGSFTIRASRAANTGAYSDLGLSSGTEYCYKVRAVGANGAPDSPFGGPSCAGTPMPTVVRVTLFGDSNTDTCEEDPNRKSSYISIVPRLGPNDAHRPCQVAGKVEAKWQAARSETIHAVNHAIASTTSGGGSFGGPDRSNQGSPNARTSVNGVTRFEAEILGVGYPWSGGEPTSIQYFPTGPITRVNAYVPGANDFVYVSMGTNDASATRNMTVAQTDANLRWMVDLWIAAGRSPDHFMLTTLAPRANTNTPTAIPDRNVLIRALAVELGVHFIDLAHFVSDDDGLTWRDPSLHIGDGTHYTDAVRAWLADQIVSWMSSVTPQ